MTKKMHPYTQFSASPYQGHMKVAAFVKNGSLVLDAGCGRGLLAKHLRETKNCFVTGIENNEAATEDAGNNCNELLIADLASGELSITKRYDFIILADVLEHLPDPGRVLVRLKEYLGDGGRMIISVPNFVNWRVRLPLLFGRYWYEDYGLRDRTHLRIFTKTLLQQEVLKAGLKIEKIDLTPNDPLVFILRRLGLSERPSYHISRICPSLFAFQFICIASNEKS